MWKNGLCGLFVRAWAIVIPTKSGIAQIRDRSATLRNASANVEKHRTCKMVDSLNRWTSRKVPLILGTPTCCCKATIVSLPRGN